MGNVQLKLYASLVGCPLVTVLIAWLAPIGYRSDILLGIGVVLELAGIGRVLIEVSDTAAKYGRLTILQALGLKKPKPIVMEAAAGISMEVSMAMQMHVIRNPQSIDERIRFLEEDLKALESTLKDHREATDKSLTELRTADQEAKAALERAIFTLKEELKDVASGGIESEYWWAVLFAAGLVLTNYNDRIAGWFA
jgi:hypothetical protein